MTIALLGLTVVLLPVMAPSGPGNSAPVDAAIVLFLFAAFASLAIKRRPIRTPAAATLGAMVVISLVSTAASPRPHVGLLTVVVEVYLIVLFWAATSILDGDRRATQKIMTIWVLSAVGWAGVMLGIYYHLLSPGFASLLDAGRMTTGRVVGASENPNLAASYLMTSLFVLLAAPRVPRALRLATGVVIVWSVVVTGSNGAMLGIAVGLVVVTIGAIARTFDSASRPVVISAAAVCVIVAATVVITASGPPQFSLTEVNQIAASQQNGPLDRSLGRLDSSTSGRLTLWSTAWSNRRSVTIGIGPGAAESLPTANGELGKTMHNDYLGFLIERGIGGVLIFAVFIVTLLGWSAALLVSRVPERRGWAVSGLAGGIIANLVMSFTHEQFHFRHLWLLLALAWVCRRLAAEPVAVPSSTSHRDQSPPQRPPQVLRQG